MKSSGLKPLELIMGALSLLLTLITFYDVPSLHTDEAWLINQFFDTKRTFSFNGSTPYTSSLFLELTNIVFKAFRPNILVLRSFNLINYLFLFLVTYKILIFKEVSYPISKCAFLFSTPLILTFSKIGLELTVIMPLFLALSFYLYECKKNKILGSLFALLAFTSHILGALPVIIYFAYRLILKKKIALELYFLLLAIMTRSAFILTGDLSSRVTNTDNLTSKLINLPILIYNSFSTSLLSLKITGTEGISNVFPILLFIFIFKDSYKDKTIKFSLTLIFLYFILITIIVPTISFRYFHFAIGLTLVFILSSMKKKKWNIYLLSLGVVLNLVFTIYNFQIPYNKGAKGIFFTLSSNGKGYKETSYHFVNTDTLFNTLESLKTKDLATDDWFIYQWLMYFKNTLNKDINVIFPIKNIDKETNPYLVYFDYLQLDDEMIINDTTFVRAGNRIDNFIFFKKRRYD